MWNTTLEEWLHSSEIGSKEFNSKADYILKLKKANAAIGTTGERIMAPGGYVYLPGSIMDGKVKNNPGYGVEKSMKSTGY